MRYVLIFICCLALVSCTSQENFKPPADEGYKSDMSNLINVSSAYINPPMAGRDIASAYMRIQNLTNDKINLISISSPVSQIIEIHNHIHDGGVMRMRKLNNLEIMSGDTVELLPGGLHFMLFETNLSDYKDAIPLILNFENLPPIKTMAYKK